MCFTTVIGNNTKWLHHKLSKTQAPSTKNSKCSKYSSFSATNCLIFKNKWTWNVWQIVIWMNNYIPEIIYKEGSTWFSVCDKKDVSFVWLAQILFFFFLLLLSGWESADWTSSKFVHWSMISQTYHIKKFNFSLSRFSFLKCYVMSFLLTKLPSCN